MGGAASAPKPGGAFRLRGRERALLVLAACALGGLLWYFYLYTPTQARSQQLRVENQQLETEIFGGRSARADLPALRAEVARARAERDAFLAQLPEQNEVAELLDQLRAAARDARVRFTGLQNVGPAAEVVPGVRLLNFSLATKGSYSRTITFLRALEALPRFTRVGRVGLTAGTEARADPNLDATYDFTVYVYTGVDPNAVPVDPNAVPNVDPNAVPATEVPQ